MFSGEIQRNFLISVPGDVSYISVRRHDCQRLWKGQTRNTSSLWCMCVRFMEPRGTFMSDGLFLSLYSGHFYISERRLVRHAESFSEISINWSICSRWLKCKSSNVTWPHKSRQNWLFNFHVCMLKFKRFERISEPNPRNSWKKFKWNNPLLK